jgi:protein import protein ZIM17
VPRPRAAKATTNTPQQPTYELTFTCIPCDTRSAHNVSKQGYHHGSVLITCPSCRNRHVISDHLNIFGDKSLTVEDLMREKGRLVKRGTLGEDGDVEFWEDGSTTTRAERQADGADPKPKPRNSAGAGGDAGQGDAPGSTFGKA